MSRSEKPYRGRLPALPPEVQALIEEEKRRPPPPPEVSERVRARIEETFLRGMRKRPRERKE